jgi:hypothetical protein
MILIAHRGNTVGPNSEKENHPDYILQALQQGFHVEIDAWIINGEVVLGHDAPTYEATNEFLENGRFSSANRHFKYRHWLEPALWIHCKNFEALNDDIFFKSHRFFHDQDDFTLTNSGFIWTYPRMLPLAENSIAVMPERVLDWGFSEAGGVCSDYVEITKKILITS